MKKMSYYTIYCTPEQTRKAIELGAPIERAGIKNIPNIIDFRGVLYGFPTAEEMIGWLEDNIKCSIPIDKSWSSGCRKWIWTIIDDFETVIDSSITFYPSRKEATLAAIDAALEYLTNNKK